MRTGLAGILLAGSMALGSQVATAVEIGEDTVLKSDVRVRSQLTKVESQEDRFQQRLRGRIEVQGKANENLIVSGRLATSQGNKATSGNSDLGGSASAGMKGHEIYVDTFNFKWLASDNLSVTGGKFKNPFYRPVKSEMIFDNDLTPEGWVVKYQTKSEDTINWWVTGSGQWVDEVHDTTADVYADVTMGGIQAGLDADVSGMNIVFGATKYDFNNLANADTLAGWPTTDYKLTNAFLVVKFDVGGMPMQVYADYVTNSEPKKDNTGYTVGVKLNKAKAAGDWDVDLWTRKLEPNAVVSAIADGDVSYADVEAMRLTFNYMLAQNAKLRLSYLTTERDASTSTTTKKDVGQLDLAFKF